MRNVQIFPLLLLTCWSAAAFGQSQALKEYQSNGNAHYWMNRSPVPGYWQQDVHYKIDAVVDDQEESITAKETLIYWNNSPDELDRVYFHLYQNAFTPNSYLSDMRENDRIKSVYGVHEALGEGTIVSELTINGKPVNYELNNTILMIKLPSPLKPNTGVEIEMNFKTFWDKEDGGNIRRRMKTFRHGGLNQKDFLHFDGVHWYPRICVYDAKFGWTTDQHLGKEFYGDYGVYEVSLTFPNQYVVEATGRLMNEREMYPGDLRERLDISMYKTERSTYTNPIPADGTTKTWKFKAENVHDFAFTADPTYRIGEVVWNGIRCIALAQEENAHLWQPTAQFVADVVRVYSEEIGMFGYPKMIAADARDGMEYPMLTLNGGNWPGHKYVIAHEVGHNWFFGMVGNNETYRASLDEGFTQFLTALSLKKISGIDTHPNGFDDGVVYNGYMGHAMSDNTARLNIHSDHFHSAERHGGGYGQVYYKTATMLYNLQYVLGDELFAAAIKNYFDQWKFCHPYWEDFRSSIIRYTKVDLNWFFDEWIEGNSTIDYKLQGIKSLGNDDYRITIKRLGSAMPIDLRVTDKNGMTADYYIPNTYFSKKTGATVLPQWTGWGLVKPEYDAVVHIPGGIKNVEIDPSGRMADINRLNNSKKMPVHLKYDNLQWKQSSFRTYEMTYRPDFWYNAIDGVKAGARLTGNFYQTRDVFNFGVWYNTGIDPISGETFVNPDVFSYTFDYRTKLKGMNFLEFDSRYIDGWVYDRLGLESITAKGRLKLGVSSAIRTNVGYTMYPFFTNALDARETKLTLGYIRPYRFKSSTAELRLQTQSSTLFSDYNYASASAEFLFHKSLGKLGWHTRLYAQYMDGANVAPESLLLLSGGNTVDQMDNRYTRSIGWFSQDPFGFDRNGSHFQMGGGLNIRGYSGFAVTNNTDTDTFMIYSGTRGASISTELDLGNLVKLSVGKINRYISINPYLFADAGVLGNQRDQWSGLRVDAGLGSIISLRVPKLSGTKPLNIRFDMPFFLNRIPQEQSDYVAFRYIMGINRSF